MKLQQILVHLEKKKDLFFKRHTLLIKHIRQLHFWICCSVTKKYCNMSIIFSFFHKIINNYYYADVFLQNQTYFWVWLWYISIPVKESHYCKINSSTQQWQNPTTILFICFFFFSQCIWKKKKSWFLSLPHEWFLPKEEV